MSKAACIAKLNDLARTAMGAAGKLYQTDGINALPAADQSRIREQVKLFNTFTPDNDPHGEHDFGSFEYVRHLDSDQNFQEVKVRIFWKIDYYDKKMEFGSEDPSDPAQTTRLLTIMLAEEY